MKRVTLSAPQICRRCGRWMDAGTKVAAIEKRGRWIFEHTADKKCRKIEAVISLKLEALC